MSSIPNSARVASWLFPWKPEDLFSHRFKLRTLLGFTSPRSALPSLVKVRECTTAQAIKQTFFNIAVVSLLARMELVQRRGHRHAFLELLHHVQLCLLAEVVDEALVYAGYRYTILDTIRGHVSSHMLSMHWLAVLTAKLLRGCPQNEVDGCR